MYYWPTASVNGGCARASSANLLGASSTPVYAGNATKTLTTAPGGGTTDVIDGFTYTYPSTYVSVVGKISVTNSCGQVGGVIANPTPVPVSALITASYATWPSTCRPQGNYVDVVLDVLNIADIACPTWGLSDPFMTECDGSSYLTATTGAPYNPVIMVPDAFLDYDPKWAACRNAQVNGPFTLPCGIYDPPRALQTQGGMAPVLAPGVTPTAAPPQSTEPPGLGIAGEVPGWLDPAESLVPAQTHKVDPQPAATQAADQPKQTQVPAEAQQDPSTKGSGNTDPGTNGSGNTDPGQNAQSDPSQQAQGQQSSSNTQQGSNNQQASTNQQQANSGTSNSGNTGNSQGSSNGVTQNAGTSNANTGQSSNSNGQANTNAQAGSDPQQQQVQPQPIPQTTIALNPQQQPQPAAATPGVAGIIMNAFGNSAPGTPAAQGGATGGSTGGNAGGATGGNAGANSGGTPGGVSGGNTGGTPGGTSGGSQAGNAPGAIPAAGFVPHAIVAQGQTLQAINPSAVQIGGQTLSAGAPAITSNGNFFSVGPAGNLIAGTVGAPGASAAPVLAFGGSSITANSAGAFVVAGQTLTPGGQIQVSGTPIALPSAGNVAIVGGVTQSLANAVVTPAPVITVGSSTYTANSAGQFIIAGQTLTSGDSIQVSGTPISLPTNSPNIAIVGGKAQNLINPASPPPPPPLQPIRGTTNTPKYPSQILKARQTHTPRGSIQVSGTPIVEATGGSYAVIAGTTQSLVTPVIAGATAAPAPAVLTLGGKTYTANAASAFVIAGQTLTPGGAITVSGTAISEMPSGSGMVVIGGSSTQVLSHATATAAGNAKAGAAAVMTLAGTTYTANAASAFVIAGQTLTPGGAITVSGTVISEVGAGTAVVIGGTSTEGLGMVTTAKATGSAGGTGGGAVASATGGSVPFEGAAAGMEVGWWRMSSLLLAAYCGLLFVI